MDYADKLPPRPWCTFAPPLWSIIPPPLTSQGQPEIQGLRQLCLSAAGRRRRGRHRAWLEIFHRTIPPRRHADPAHRRLRRIWKPLLRLPHGKRSKQSKRAAMSLLLREMRVARIRFRRNRSDPFLRGRRLAGRARSPRLGFEGAIGVGADPRCAFSHGRIAASDLVGHIVQTCTVFVATTDPRKICGAFDQSILFSRPALPHSPNSGTAPPPNSSSHSCPAAIDRVPTTARRAAHPRLCDGSILARLTLRSCLICQLLREARNPHRRSRWQCRGGGRRTG